MVPPEQMQEPVREKHRQFGSQVRAALTSLPPCRRDTDYEVAEEGTGVKAVLPLSLGEREYVGGPVLFTISSVQSLDLIVVGQ